MKNLLLCCFVFFCALCVHGQTLPADDILAFVRSRLPDEPLQLTGSLIKRAPNGYRTRMPVVMNLDWAGQTPTANYRIGDESLTITWKNNTPSYAFSNPENTPKSDILGTGITWADLSFSVFWWTGSKLVDEGKKLNRECYIIDVPVPDSKNTMRLWIEKNMGMLLEARTLNQNQKEITHLRIDSIKKMDGMWIAKDLIFDDKKTGTKTTLRISDLEWLNRPPDAPQPHGDVTTAFDPAESVYQLAIDLYKKLAVNAGGNICFSPYSISSALAMTYGGARGGTAEQINEVLYFGGPDATHPAFDYLRKTLDEIQEQGHVQLNVANALWPQQDHVILPDYLTLTKKYYGSEIHPVDYKTNAEGARQQINTWVEDQTNDKIKDLIGEGSLDSLTRLVLVNAIYFKGDWAQQFNKTATRPGPFTLMDGTNIDVQMMSQTGDFKLARNERFQAVELSYEGGELSMIILLPNPGDKLEPVSPDGFDFQKKEVSLQLPKFKLESSFYLGSTLAGMGMPLAFSGRADFSGMDGSHDLTIDDVIHKAFVEVSEEGTEAAAATAVAIRTTSLPPQFIVDRPFLFFIRENSTDTILFMGRVTDPR